MLSTRRWDVFSSKWQKVNVHAFSRMFHRMDNSINEDFQRFFLFLLSYSWGWYFSAWIKNEPSVIIIQLVLSRDENIQDDSKYRSCYP